MKKKRLLFDILFISVLLCLSLLFFALTVFVREEGNTVIVKISGEVVGEYPLNRDAEIEINAGSNFLVIKNGEAYLTDANCPDRTCVKTGKISYAGQSIICLPNEVIIEIVGDSGESVDLIS